MIRYRVPHLKSSACTLLFSLGAIIFKGFSSSDFIYLTRMGSRFEVLLGDHCVAISFGKKARQKCRRGDFRCYRRSSSYTSTERSADRPGGGVYAPFCRQINGQGSYAGEVKEDDTKEEGRGEHWSNSRIAPRQYRLCVSMSVYRSSIPVVCFDVCLSLLPGKL